VVVEVAHRTPTPPAGAVGTAPAAVVEPAGSPLAAEAGPQG
jgi:hypothetical protein